MWGMEALIEELKCYIPSLDSDLLLFADGHERESTREKERLSNNAIQGLVSLSLLANPRVIR